MHSHGCKAVYGENKPCLNPCFNGICTSTLVTNPQPLTLVSLNPCFNGRCTSTKNLKVKGVNILPVLILVLMEDALVRVNIVPQENYVRS